MSALLDSAVVVDLLRNHPPAINWLRQQSNLGTSPAVWLEIIEGAQDLSAQRRALIACELTELAYALHPWRFEPGVRKYRSVEEAYRHRQEWERRQVRRRPG